MDHSFTDLPVFGLLHVAEHVQHPVNLAATKQSPVDVYLRCATLCARSFARQGMTFTLVTNAATMLQRRAAELGLNDLAIAQHDFRWSVPAGLRFHSAHYKLELIEAFATGLFGPAALLVDIDTVLLRPFSLPPLRAGGICAYDIGHEIFVHTDWPVHADLETVAERPLKAPRWWGGEFLAGTQDGFSRLSKEVARSWPRYLSVANTLHHVGDEMLVSAALNTLHGGDLPVADAGHAGGVVRWWSARTTFPQPPLHDVLDRSLWHLPADKPFLCAQLVDEFDPVRFVAAYRRHLLLKSMARRVYTLADRLRGRPGKFVAHW